VSTGPDMRSRYEQALAEVEEMKRTLREHARHVAAREKELEDQRLELAGRQGRRRAAATSPSAASSIVDEAEKRTELDRLIAEAKKREQHATQELALAKAERERLDEREETIRKVERELAGLRDQLQQERARLGGSAPTEPEPVREPQPDGDPPPPTPLPQPPADPDLEPAATAKRRRSSMLADPQLKRQS
jgi:cell division septum initiation protein DivIVA